MRPIADGVDVVIANEEDLQAVLGIPVENAEITGGRLDLGGYQSAAEQVARDFRVSMVAITLRESLSASDNGWSGVLWDAATGTFHQSQRYAVRLVDRIGGGDSFAAGSDLRARSRADRRTPRCASRVAASALKQTIPGDFNRVSVAEVDHLAGGDASGRVQR